MGKNKSINGMMEAFRILIWNASEDEIIKVRLEPFQYNQQRMDALKVLFNDTLGLIDKRKKEKGDWQIASESFNKAKQSVTSEFRKIRNKLKFYYSSTSAVAQTLELYRDNISKYADFVVAAKYFYSKLLLSDEAIDKLIPFGYSREIIAAQADEVNGLDRLKEARERESGDAQYATKERNAKMDELEDACNELTRLAKLVFEDDEAQYLEKLGIIARS
jgi:predicted  nucleic acid-binding Zn-ribbon protein